MHNVRNVIMSKFRFSGLFSRGNVGFSALPNLVLGSDIPSDPSPFANTMQYVKRNFKSRSSYGRRRRYTPRYRPIIRQTNVTSFVRSSAPQIFSLAAGSFSRVTDIVLSQVQTTDLTGTWDMYRIKKVQAMVHCLVDPANSGVVNNSALQCYTANDPIGNVSAPTALSIGAYANHKCGVISSGGLYKYTFYPKVSNSVDVSGVATGLASYGTANPWLNLSTAGVAVPHHRFLGIFTSNDAVSTQKLVITWKIFFECKSIH